MVAISIVGDYTELVNNMFGIGLQELLVILVIVLVLFGGKKLPELSKSVGEAIRELRKGITGEESSDSSSKAKSKSTK